MIQGSTSYLYMSHMHVTGLQTNMILFKFGVSNKWWSNDDDQNDRQVQCYK